MTQPKQELVCVCGAVWEGQELMEAPPQRTWIGLTEEEQLNVFAELIAKPRCEYEVYKAYELALKEKNT
jgi:hypothetical protein